MARMARVENSGDSIPISRLKLDQGVRVLEIGRTSSVQINAKGQPVLSQITDLDQASYEYDSRGRLHILMEGTGTDARTTTLDYYGSMGSES